MDIKMRTAVFCCIAMCMLTVSLPLVAEVTYVSQGGQAWADNVINGSSGGAVTAPETEDNIFVENHNPTVPETESETIDAVPDIPSENNGKIVLLNAKSGEAREMELEEYIVGVVAAEMPYTFNSEALKAQAVAARSYCIYKSERDSGHGEDGADVCTSYSHCAAYISEEGLIEKYGEDNAKKIMNKVRAAVEATKGEIITYNGKTALALFHSRSWKYTESSENVWGGSYPYLVSVSTPEADSVSTVTVTEKELEKLFNSSYAIKVSASSEKPKKLLTSEKNSSGRQASLFYEGQELKAKKLRSLLGLRSCDFEYEKVSGGWIFTVHGYGHGVGMSQYGANEMAKRGSDYKEILTHYYTGVEIGTVFN